MKNVVVRLAWKILGRKELAIDAEKCVGCGKCYRTCHHNAVEKNGQGRYEIRTEQCMRCYHCKENCPKQAIGPACICHSGRKSMRPAEL